MSRVGILKGEQEKRNRRWGAENRYPGCWVVGTGKCGKRICTFPLRWQKASTEKRHLAEHSLGWPYARNVSSKQLVVFWSKRGGWAGRRERNRRQDSTQWALRCWVVTWSLESRWSWLNFYDSGQTSLPSILHGSYLTLFFSHLFSPFQSRNHIPIAFLPGLKSLPLLLENLQKLLCIYILKGTRFFEIVFKGLEP